MFLKFILYSASILLLQLVVANATPILPTIDDRIVGGIPTSISDVQYLVQVRENNRFSCGGTLVAPQFVVCAAHCFIGVPANQVTVVGGATKLSDTGVVRRVKSIMRSNFNARTMNNDVVVLKLESPLKGKNIAPIELCTGEIKAGMTMKVSGWGKTKEYSKTPSNQLMTVNVPVTPWARCNKQYGNSLTKTMFCASQPGTKDACSGDSGGPGIINGKLCGIVSFGVGCARSQYSGVYTNVLQVKSFIQECMKK